MAFYFAPVQRTKRGSHIVGYPVQNAPLGTGAIHDRGDGYKLIRVPEQPPHPLWYKVAEDHREPLSVAARRWFEQTASISFSAAVGIWLLPQLQPTADGRYEVWCGNPHDPIWTMLVPMSQRAETALPLVVRDFWRQPRVVDCFRTQVGFVPALTVAALGVLLAAGMLPPEAAWLLVGVLPVTDAFTNTTGTALSAHNASWAVMSGVAADMQISNNAAAPNKTSALSGYRWTGDTFNGNHYSLGQIITNTGGADIGPAVRCQSGAFSLYSYYANGTKSMNRIDAGTNTALGSGGAYSLNDVFKLSANGSTIRGELNGALDTAIAGNPFTDTNHTGGSAGLAGNTANANNQLDNWEAGDILPINSHQEGATSPFFIHMVAG